MSARAPETLQRLRNTDWEVLLARIKAKECTPILGTGTRSEVLTLRSKIARDWAEKYGYPRLEGTLNLARVARFISIQYDSDFTKRRLVEQLQTIPEPNFADPNNPYSILARLPLPVYITTKYDDFMFQALSKANRDV